MGGSHQAACVGGDALPAAPSGTSVRVWDPLVRVFHWSLVASFAVAWASGDEWQALHEAAGYAIMGLLAIRVAWGFVGTRHARFSDFVHRPSAVLAYLVDIVRLRARRHIGHNPAGGAMVIALIVMLSLATVTGFMMTTDGYARAEWVEEVHEAAANLAVLLVGLHLLGVFAASLSHGENLVKAMITGRKRRD